MMPGIQPKGPSIIVNSEKTRDSIANVDVFVLFIKFFIERLSLPVFELREYQVRLFVKVF